MVALTCGLLPFLLFVLGLSLSVQKVLGTPDALKYALSESGIYDTAVTSVLNQVQEDAGISDNSSGGVSAYIPLERPEIQTTVKQAFPPSSLQPQVERAIDDTYTWLNGETKEFNTSLDLKQSKEKLASDLTTYAKEKAAALPSCPADTPIGTGFDAFNATCLPAGITKDQAAALTQAKLDQNEFFKKPSLDLQTGQDGQNLALGGIALSRSGFQQAGRALWIGGIVAVISILLAVFCSQPWRVGLRRVAKITLSIGITTVILACLSVFLSNKAANLLANSTHGSAAFQTSIADFVRILASDIRGWWLAYGILLIVLGIATLIALRIWKEKEIIEHTNALPPEARPHVVVN